MKLILRADVESLGSLGEVVTVKAGYARNWLLPQGLAMAASPANLKIFEQERRKLEARMDAARAEAKAMQARLESLEVVIPVHVGENEKLYGSVTTTIVGDALAALGIEVDRRRILLDTPIRHLGEYPVRVRLHASVIGLVRVKVVPDNFKALGEKEAILEAAADGSLSEKAAEQAAG